MKKIILATAALALVFVSCNHEPEFDGMKEYIKIRIDLRR